MTRILIADDNVDICRMLKTNLELDGYDVTIANDGTEAKNMAIADPPDIILLDGMMPGLDGLEVLAALKAEPTTADVPVIMVSARTTDDQVWAGWEAGASCYITKPIQISELLKYVKMLETGVDADDHEATAAQPRSEISSVLETLESYNAGPI